MKISNIKCLLKKSMSPSNHLYGWNVTWFIISTIYTILLLVSLLITILADTWKNIDYLKSLLSWLTPIIILYFFGLSLNLVFRGLNIFYKRHNEDIKIFLLMAAFFIPIGMLIFQGYLFLKNGSWISFSTIDMLTSLGSDWAISPKDWLGCWRILCYINPAYLISIVLILSVLIVQSMNE